MCSPPGCALRSPELNPETIMMWGSGSGRISVLILCAASVPFMPGIRQMPLRSLMDAGVRVSGSSDWPVAPFEPLLAIERAVSRVTRGDERLQPEESISINQALSMYTREAAHALGEGSFREALRPLLLDFAELTSGAWSALFDAAARRCPSNSGGGDDESD